MLGKGGRSARQLSHFMDLWGFTECGFVRAKVLQEGRAVWGVGAAQYWGPPAPYPASQTPVSLMGGFKGFLQCFCFVS